VAFGAVVGVSTARYTICIVIEVCPPRGASPRSSNRRSLPSLRRSVALAITLFLCAATLPAQSLTFGEISGTVSDAGSRPIGEAEVRVRERNSGALRWLLTGRNGAFRFGVLPAGRYDLTIEALGYRPVTYLDVPVAAGQAAQLATHLRTATFPLSSIDTVRSVAFATQPGAWLLERGYADRMGSNRVASDAAVLTTSADENGIEGLPWRLTQSVVDGSRMSGMSAPLGLGADGATLALPIRSASHVEVGGLGFDVEFGGTGLGVRSTTQRAGRSSASTAQLEGGSALVGGAFTTGGPMQGDTAQAMFGADYQRSEISRPSLLGTDPAFATDVASAAQSTYGADVSAFGAPADRITERYGAFGRLDWQPGERFAVSVRASGSRLTSRGLAESSGAAAAFGDDYEGLGAQAAISIFGRLTKRLSQEVRVSTDVADVRGARGMLPLTSFAGSGLAIGGGESFQESRTVPRASALLHADLGAHRLKAGFSVATHLSDSRLVSGSAGEFRYGDVADFTAGNGAWRAVDDGDPAGEFRLSETSFFFQDAWRVADGFALTFGARFDATRLPVGDIEQNAEWLALTGIDNRDIERKRSRMSPRVGVRWELGSQREWLVEGGAGVFQDLPDHRDLAEALSFDRGATVRAGVGALGAWPAAPTLTLAPAVGQAITLLGPDFEGPRTRRLALNITRRLGGWNGTVGAVYRHTDFLSRRRDLNLSQTALAADQHGRPIYGTLRQVGTLLAVEPGTNRRFTGIEAAHVLESTGSSDYWGLTLGMQRVRESGLSLATSYTFSRTTDNVPGFAAQRLSPFPERTGGLDWTEGRSDLDVPHRVLVGAEWGLGTSGAVRFGALYRLSAGLPFTPGLRDGVDANGDGDGSNDPAFIDTNLPGLPTVLSEWGCLRQQTGFVERNACRGEFTHRLDVRASFRVANLAIGRVDLVLDALDVIVTERGRPDNALLLIDRNGAITTDPLTGASVLPYVANPAFGNILADRSPGVLWRAGLRVTP